VERERRWRLGLERMDQTLALVRAGHLQTLPLITHHYPVAQAAEAWALIREKREPVLGVILDWEEV
jgi:threonine dehydrogenase-like Zn-dependent dehydrogenase